MVRYFAVVTNNAYLCIVVYKIVRIMCTRERELELGQKLEIVEDAGRRIAKYEKKHGKPMSKTGQAMWMLRGREEVYDKSLLA